MEEWKEYKLGEIADIQTGPFGSQLHQSDYVEKGTPCIMPTNIGTQLDIKTEGIAYVKDEDLKRLERHCVKHGDIIYSRRGDIEKCAFISHGEEGWLCGTGCLRIRVNVDFVNQHFVAYQLSTTECKKWIVGNAVGTTMLNLNTGILRELPLQIPKLITQNTIASILSSLDDKIELNRRINANLEAQAQALFKSWFVDFEPFRDGEFVESELGMIPLSEICEQITDGVHNSVKDEPNSNYILLSCKNITGGVLSKKNYRSISKSTFESLRMRTKLAKGDVLLSSVGTIGEIAIVEEDPINYEFQRSVAIVKPKKNIGTYFLYNALLASKVRLQHAAHGAVQQCLFIGDLKKFKVICCDTEKVSRYNETVRPLFEEIAKLHQESTRLATLRDTLLPRLMSGEIKVGDVTL